MIVLGIIILIIFIVCMIPIGVDFNFEDEKLRLSARVSKLLLQVFPKTSSDKQPKPKPEKKKEEKVKAKPSDTKTKEKKSLDLIISKEDIFYLVKKVFGKIGRFGRSFDVDRFMFHFIAAGNDPYKVAKEFAYVNAALCSLAPLCEKRFRCKDVDVWTDCDFDELIPTIEIGFSIYIRIGAIFALLFGIINSAIAMFVKNRWRLFYNKHFDKEAYEEELEEAQKLPNLLSKVKRSKSVFNAGLNKLKSDVFKIERTEKNYG